MPINARVEKVAHGPFFRSIWPHRAIVPIDNWFEWVDEDGPKKQPYLIRRKDGHPSLCAGTAVDFLGDGEKFVLVGQGVEPRPLPEPTRRHRGIDRLFEQFRRVEQSAVAEQSFTTGFVAGTPGNLNQPTPAILLAVAVSLRRVSQVLGQLAGFVLRQVSELDGIMRPPQAQAFGAPKLLGESTGTGESYSNVKHIPTRAWRGCNESCARDSRSFSYQRAATPAT
ncbi:Putative SOS response-associated peptidase [Pseudomonas wadenswilerensis]|uniref:Putative SOS response-associated peptidase n=1 Tax=Pseudomonas wadenswilerensis TaxID=1785161 RepID=A0A380SWY5_9PSED|nr:putative SOS response-associated peptidase [Pseudomonas wadenswilerensis]